MHAAGEDQLLELGPRAGRAAVADPAHHHVGVLVERALVDHHPRRAQAGHHLLAGAEDRRPEAVGGVVGQRQGVGGVLGERQPAQRGEALLPPEGDVEGGARQQHDGGREEGPALALADQHLPAAGQRLGERRAGRRAGPALGQRADVGGLVVGVADAQGGDGGGQAGAEALPGGALDDDPLGRHAELAGVGEAADAAAWAARSRSAPASTIIASLPEPSAM